MASLIIVSRRLKNLSIKQVVAALVVSTIFFNEFLIYYFQTLRWPSMPERDKQDDMVVLFVADPQLIGVQNEKGFPVGPIARWDCDRYLRKTFSLAYYYTKPDVIIFLGDLMDEGSKATEEEYQSYVYRFKSIYSETKYTKTIHIPGDNDIGGEGGDFRTPSKISRFENSFEPLEGVVSYLFTDFVKADIQRFYEDINRKRQGFEQMTAALKSPIRIVINHESILTKPKLDLYPVLQSMKPNLLVTAHWHWSVMHNCPACLSPHGDKSSWGYHQQDMKKVSAGSFEDLSLSDPYALTEIQVPTCSYRMGVPYMGFGVAIINRLGHIKYTVLWLPSRYQVLYVYIVMLVIAVVLLLINFIFSSSGSQSYRSR